MWQALVWQCAKQCKLLGWQPIDPPDSSNKALKNEQDDDDNEEGDGDNEQGSILFLGL